MRIDDEIKIIKERLDMLESSKDNFKLDERAAKSDIITRSYRIHKDAVEQFNKLVSTDKFKIYNIQDLVSQAFWEFVDKYSNSNSCSPTGESLHKK